MSDSETYNKQVLQMLEERCLTSEASLADTQKTLRTTLFGLAAVLVICPIAVAMVVTKFPMERFIHTDNAKAICEAQTHDAPLVTTNTVTEFAKDCALDIDTFGYDNVEQSLGRMAQRCLLPNFREKFFTASWLNDRVSTVKQGMYRVHSQTTGPSLIESQGNTPDGFMWRVQVPIKRFFRQGDSPKGINERVYIMDIYRVKKDAFNPVGLGINAINEKTATR